MKGTGDVGDDGKGLGRPYEPPVLQHEGPAHIHVDLGSSTDRTERAAREIKSGTVIEGFGKPHRHVEKRRKRATMCQNVSIEGERPSVLAHRQLIARLSKMTSTMNRALRTYQRVPQHLHYQPDKPVQRPNTPPKLELKGEGGDVSYEQDGNLINDASGVPSSDKDASERPKKLSDVAEQINKRSEHGGKRSPLGELQTGQMAKRSC